MMRILFIALIGITVTLLFLQGRLNERNGEKPVFLRTDKIAEVHRTKINVSIHSIYRPDSTQLEVLKKDYSNLWAHLNYLYETNDVETGKAYYTEGWFKQINHHFSGTLNTGIKRSDLQHELHIENWAADGLVCTVTDSNLVFHYQYPDNTTRTSKANLQMVLLYQGDHWRIDALRMKYEVFQD
jgi:hypothetical protein